MASEDDWLRSRWIAAAAIAVTVALAAWAAWTRFDALMVSPYPVGIDGYFYPIQLRSLFESGGLYYPSSPLAIYWMAPAALATDPITGAKLGAAVGTALGVLPAYYLGRRLGGEPVVGVLAAVLWATSAESFYLSAEFVKNGLGLTVASTYFCALLWALDRGTPRRLLVAVVLLVATALTHKQATALAVLASAGPVVAWARDRGVSWRALGAGFAGLVVVFGALGVLMPDRFLGGHDAPLLRGLFTTALDVTVPVLDPGGPRVLRFGHEALMAGVIGLVALILAVSARRVSWLATPPGARHDRALAVSLAAIAVFIAMPWIDVRDPQGLGFRLRLVAFVPLVIVAPAVCGRALAAITPLTRTALVLGFALGWAVSRPPTTTEGMVTVSGHMQAAVRAAEGYVPEDHVIICPQRSLVFMITWYTGRRARLRPEEIPAARRWRLLPSRLIHPELMTAIDATRADPPAGVPIPIGLHPRHHNGVVLMPEVTWQHLMSLVPPPVRDTYRRWLTI